MGPVDVFRKRLPIAGSGSARPGPVPIGAWSRRSDGTGLRHGGTLSTGRAVAPPTVPGAALRQFEASPAAGGDALIARRKATGSVVPRPRGGPRPNVRAGAAAAEAVVIAGLVVVLAFGVAARPPAEAGAAGASVYLPVCARHGRVPSPALELEFVGQVGGPSWGFDVEGDLAYRGEGPHLVVMDLSDHAAMREVGRSEPLPGMVVGADVVGAIAYVAAGPAGLLSVDVRDPAHPRLLARADTSGAARDVAVVGHSALVAVNDVGVEAFDVSEPTAMRRTARVDFPEGAWQVHVGDGFAVARPGRAAAHADEDPAQPARVLDLGQPDAPRVVATLPSVWAVAAAGRRAYLCHHGEDLTIYDMADPAAPRLLSTTELPREHGYGPWPGGLAGDQTRVLVSPAWWLYAYDVTDPIAPVLASARPAACGNTAQARLVGDRLVRSCDDLDLVGPRAELMQLGPLVVDDVSDLSVSRQAGEYWAGSSRWYDVHAVGSYLYAPVAVPRRRTDAAFSIGSVRRTALVDAGEASRMRLVGFLDTPAMTDMVLVGEIGHVATVSGTLESYDLSDPTRPRRLGARQIGGQRHWMAADGANIAALAETQCPSHPSMVCDSTLHVIDAPDPAAVRALGAVTLPLGTEHVEWRGGFAYALHRGLALDPSAADSRLLVVDARDPARPVLLNEVPLEDARSLDVDQDRLYVGSGESGVMVFDLRVPSAPHLAARIDAPELTVVHDVDAASGVLYVAGAGGIAAFDVGNNEQPLLLHSVVTMPYDQTAGRIEAGMVKVMPDGRVYVSLSTVGCTVDDHALAAYRVVRH